MMLQCCLCLYLESGVAPEADTIIRGYAVCYDHMGYAAQGMEWHSMYTRLKEALEREDEDA